MRYCSGFLLMLFLISGCAKDRDTDINSILHSENSRNGKLRIKSCFISRRHGMALVDCHNKEIMVSVEFSKGVIDSEKGKELVELGYSQWPPGSNVEISIDLIGFIKEKEENGRGIEVFVTKINSVSSRTL